MADQKRVVALVAFYRDDLERRRAYPSIIGCIDADALEVLLYEDEDRWWREMKDKVLGPAVDDYEFRTVDVLLPVAELQKLIAVHEIVGAVDDTADTTGRVVEGGSSTPEPVNSDAFRKERNDVG